MVTGRAGTPAEKFAVMAGLLAAWQEVSYLRLGQFLVSVLPEGSDLFYAEDEALLRDARAFAASMKAADEKEGPLKGKMICGHATRDPESERKHAMVCVEYGKALHSWEEDGGTMTGEQFAAWNKEHGITWEAT